MNGKIVFILPSLCVGGAEMNTVKLSNEMVRNGKEVYIITILNINNYEPELNRKIQVISLNCKRFISALQKLNKTLGKLNPEAIFTNMWPISLITILSLLTRPKLISRTIIIEHINITLGLKNSSIFERIAERIFHSFIGFFVKAVIGVSPGVVNSLLRSNNWAANKFKFIPNPIFQKDSLKINRTKNFKRIPSTLNILAVGNFKPQKDYLTMFRVISRLKEDGVNVKLKIAGGGNSILKYKEMAKTMRLSDNIDFLGIIKDLNTLYKEADIYLMTSSWEGFGNTLAEALSNGCRCVATNCESGPGYILGNGKYGSLGRVGDPDSICSAIYKELKTEREIGIFEESIKDYSIEKITQAYLDLLD